MEPWNAIPEILNADLPASAVSAIRHAMTGLDDAAQEELAQEIVLQCLEIRKLRSKLREPMHPRDYLRAVWRARQQAHRAKHRHRPVPLDLEQVPGGRDASVEKLLEDLKAGLSDSALLVLQYLLEGHSVADTADLLGISPATAYRRADEIAKAVKDLDL